MNHLQLEDISLFYEKSGQGPALILLHGNGEDHHIFDPLANRLKADYTVYALDSRGHGRSTSSGALTYQVMAKDLAHFIDMLSLHEVRLLGFSDGAIVSLLFAMKHPDRLHSMALLGVNLQPQDFLPNVLEALQTEYEQTKDPLLELMLMQPDISLESLRSVMVPSLVVCGEHDLFEPSLYPKISRTLPQGELLCLSGHNHDSYIVGTDILYPRLLPFFMDGISRYINRGQRL